MTIQVQEVELVGGAPRQGNFLSTPGGHRVLGKQLSADNAETHRWPHPFCHHVPWWLQNSQLLIPIDFLSLIFLVLNLFYYYKDPHTVCFCFVHSLFLVFFFLHFWHICFFTWMTYSFWNTNSVTVSQPRHFMCERADLFVTVLKIIENPSSTLLRWRQQILHLTVAGWVIRWDPNTLEVLYT